MSSRQFYLTRAQGLGAIEGCLANATLTFGGFNLSKYEVLAVNVIDDAMAKESSFMR